MAADDPVTHPPPPGGYGGAPPSTRFGPAPAPESDGGGPRRSLGPFITVGVILTCLSTVLVLVVVGVRRYIASAKTAEVRSSLAEMTKNAATAYEPAHRMCPSTRLPVPAEESWIRGHYYQSTRAEWLVDEPSNAGFACLHFELSMPQYFQYRYEATPSSFTARGRGDLNGDGVFSDFAWSGHVEKGRLVVARSLTEKNTEE